MAETGWGYSRLGIDVKNDGGTSGDIDIRSFTCVAVICKLTALVGGTTPSVAFNVDYKLPDGTYVQVDTKVALTAVGFSIFQIGPGLSTPAVSGSYIRVRWTVVGAPTTATGDIHIQGEPEY